MTLFRKSTNPLTSRSQSLKSVLLVLLFLFCGYRAHSQNTAVYGVVQSARDTITLPGATVMLMKASDPAAPAAAVTDGDGRFKFERVAPGQYTIKVTYLGFKPFTRSIQVRQQPVDLGLLSLQEAATTMNEVQILGQIPLGEQLGDTTQFNARAFKTAPNASAEDLVQKMPGITILDGKIQAQGEEVMEILVDGKRFFEGDVEAALRNLPAEVIAHIQIFDKKSDQAEFSGFDDGNSAKTINIVTRPDRRRGQSGQASVGFGTDDRYMAGASVNMFSGDRRLTLTGIRNNINSSDYSIGETPGGGMRGRRGGANGIITTNRLGLNYSDMWGQKVEVSGNYAIDHRQVNQGQYKFRDYLLPSDSGQAYTETNRNTNVEVRQRLKMRLKYEIDDRNELLFKPTISFGHGNAGSYFLGRTVNDYNPINQTENNSTAENASHEIENDIHYRHRFVKKGRTFSTSLNTQHSFDDGDSYRIAENIFYQRQNPYEMLDQYRDNTGKGFSWEANASYTEPLGERSRMQLEYQISNRQDDSDRRTFNLAEQTGNYTLLDTTLSNIFRSDYLTQQAEAGYQYSTKKLRAQLEAEYQQARLQNDQEFPRPHVMNRTFYSVLPSAELEYRFSKTRNLRLDYRTSTNAPSLGQLQDLVDPTNPLHLRTGNPNLKQSYQNRLNLRYRTFDAESNKVFYIGMRASMIRNNITNSTIVADAATALSDGIVLERGSQLTRPVNLDEENWDLRTFFNYGQPLHLIQSNFSLNGSVGISRRPGMVNEQVNFSNASNFRLGVSLSSNISEAVDFNFSTHANYNLVRNSLLPERNNKYFNQSTSLRYNWIFWKGLVYRTELNHQVNAGLSAGYDNNFLLWNMSISKKLFRQQRGEISLSVNDLLEQNSSISRNITDLYVEDVQSEVLLRYFMLTFTYNIRNFSGR